jgi:hypothetical protein
MYISGGTRFIIVFKAKASHMWNKLYIVTVLSTPGSGPLTDNGLGAIAQVHTAANRDPFGRPDIELISTSFGVGSDFGAFLKDRFANLEDDAFDAVFGPHLGRETFGLFPQINRPLSRCE